MMVAPPPRVQCSLVSMAPLALESWVGLGSQVSLTGEVILHKTFMFAGPFENSQGIKSSIIKTRLTNFRDTCLIITEEAIPLYNINSVLTVSLSFNHFPLSPFILSFSPSHNSQFNERR